MLKRSLASFAAVAVSSGAVVAPANAVTVTVNDDTTCTIKVTEEEANLAGLTAPANLSKERAAQIKADYLDNQLSALGAEIVKLEKELADSKLDEPHKKELESKLEEKRKRFTVNNNLKKALEACSDGKNYDSNQSDDPKQPDDSNQSDDPKQPDDSNQSDDPKQPDDSKQPGGSDKPGDSNQSDDPKQPDDSNKPEDSNTPGGSEKPEGPKQPDVERGLSSIDGAGIGVIVAVLGILAAALSFIKPLLPAQLRALLP
ncbi:hypothetical protein WU85_08160 [Corynebacterium striatum]|nr:hypothetical protein WU85_08160 [Corynebacterium striatum]